MRHWTFLMRCAALVLAACSFAAGREPPKINNDQVHWTPTDSLKVYVHFSPELAAKMGHEQKSPTRRELLDLLTDENRWVAAHCILVSRYAPDAEVESKAISNGYSVEYAGLALRLTYDFDRRPIDANGKAIFDAVYENVEDQQKKLVEYWTPRLQRPLTHSLISKEIWRLGGDTEAPSRLQFATFSGDKFGPEHFEMLAHLDELEWFSCHDVRGDSTSLRYLSKLPSLVRIDIVKSGKVVEGFEYLDKHPRIESIYLSNLTISRNSLEVISHLPNLKVLEHEDVQFPIDGGEALMLIALRGALGIGELSGIPDEEAAKIERESKLAKKR
jgi:hypothetical protein